ncbi:hypothetical protein AMTR_s00070p00187500 [Amborella trichopoda]|uniref:Uncharacterized protein n=1 Tax=Amborella trichopoda TaxID=13333 RepID=U5DJ86_AMBTC|nr:hypothetical protein AMTR_s00070p00187500 [Amborella trichopoda]
MGQGTLRAWATNFGPGAGLELSACAVRLGPALVFLFSFAFSSFIFALAQPGANRARAGQGDKPGPAGCHP